MISDSLFSAWIFTETNWVNEKKGSILNGPESIHLLLKSLFRKLNESPVALSWIIISVVTLIWGSSFLMLKKALIIFSPQQVVSGRMAIAGLVFLPVAIKKAGQISRRQWLQILLFALVANVGVSFSYALAQSRIDSSLNGILNTLSPLMTLLIGVVLFRQVARRFQVMGITLGLLGAGYLVFLQQDGSFGALNMFALFSVLATFGNGLMANLLKFRLGEFTPLSVASLTFLVTLIPALFFWFASGAQEILMEKAGAGQAFVFIGFLALLANGAALLLVAKLVQISDPVFASLTTYLIPIVAVCWGIWDGERIYLAEMFAMVVISVSIYLVNKDS